MDKLFARILPATFTLVFLAACKPAVVSEWLVFDSLGEVTIYLDPSTIEKKDNNAWMWVLIDYKNPQLDKTGKQVLSDKLHYQFDCRQKTLSIIGSSAHSGAMGGGETINVNPDPPQLTPIDPATLAEGLWQRACE